MVDPSVRIRLEGRVEELERALHDWSAALKAARHRKFNQASDVLNRGELLLPDHGDQALSALLARQTSLRRSLEKLVTSRLELLGMPSIDRARGAAWLVTEPVLYEHHRLSTSFGCRLTFGLAWLGGFAFIISRGSVPFAVSLSLLVLWLLVKFFGWSDVVLTARRLIIEGQVINLSDVKSIHLIRPFMQYGPLSFEVEIRCNSGAFSTAKIRHASAELRTALTRLGIKTGHDWGPY